jgi:hypothetical protein
MSLFARLWADWPPPSDYPGRPVAITQIPDYIGVLVFAQYHNAIGHWFWPVGLRIPPAQQLPQSVNFGPRLLQLGQHVVCVSVTHFATSFEPCV